MLRFAFTPTGDMSVENLRVGLFNFILAKQHNENLLIRIDDTNKEENIEGKDKEILEILNLFSIDYSQVVYESENLKYHQKMAMQLLTQKKAFSCFCCDEKLEELQKEAQEKGQTAGYDGFCATLSDETVLNTNAPFTVRIAMPKESITFHDALKGELSFEPNDVDSFIILRHDKTPTPNYASSVDDMLYNISTIIQEEEQLNNSAKQIHVRKSLGYDKEILYIHVPAVLNAQTHKNINQQENETSVKWLIEEGFLPAAIANYLVLIGNQTPTDIFTLEEAVSWFNVNNISKNSVQFDINTLRLINQKHLELIDDMRLSKLLGFADESIGQLGKLFLEECTTLKEIKSKIDAIFLLKEATQELEEEIKTIKQCLQTAPFFNRFDDLETYVSQKTQLKEENLLKPLRYVLTGEYKGPKLADIYGLIKNYLGEIVK